MDPTTLSTEHCQSARGYGAVIVNATTFGKERKRAASASAGLDGRTCRHDTASPRTALKTRSQSDAGVTHKLYERAPKWTVHEDTAAAVHMDWMD